MSGSCEIRISTASIEVGSLFVVNECYGLTKQHNIGSGGGPVHSKD